MLCISMQELSACDGQWAAAIDFGGLYYNLSDVISGEE